MSSVNCSFCLVDLQVNIWKLSCTFAGIIVTLLLAFFEEDIFSFHILDFVIIHSTWVKETFHLWIVVRWCLNSCDLKIALRLNFWGGVVWIIWFDPSGGNWVHLIAVSVSLSYLIILKGLDFLILSHNFRLKWPTSLGRSDDKRVGIWVLV